jgi:hypothetical protein
MRITIGCIAFMMLATGCKKAGSGTVHGVRYEVALEGSYELHQHSDREQVWIPSDDERPFVSLQVAPNPRNSATDKADPCDPKSDASEGGGEGGLLFVRAGDSVELKAFSPPHGAAVMISRCIPPGDEGVMCTASFNDGELPAERKTTALRACKSLVIR